VTRVLHILDESCDESHFQNLRALMQRDSGQITHHVCSVDPNIVEAAQRRLQAPIHPANRRLLRAMNFAPRLPSLQRGLGAEVLHAWGIAAATICAARLPDLPLLLTLIDPQSTEQSARYLRALPRAAAVAVGSQVIRRRLLTAGVADDRLVVIRGPVDFARINQARKDNVRAQVAADASPIVLLAGPSSIAGGQFYALWACAIVSQIIPSLRVIMPYESRERQRLNRFLRGLKMTDMLIETPAEWSWHEHVACADVLLFPPTDEVCTEPLAAAMAAGVVIVGTAVRSVAEIIADKSNGLLCKPKQARLLAARLLTALEDAELRRSVTDTARAQAYEVFSSRAFLDNYARLYENVLAGRPLADEIRDTAMVS
jgi:glycosyltransferase involved in cell wall biosynthesis